MGCTIAGEHVFGPDLPDCWGCVPYPAEVGRLCWECSRYLARLLREAGAQHAALLADLEPGTRSSEPVSGSRAPGVPLSLTPLDCADELQAHVSDMTAALAADFPDDPPPAQLRTTAGRQTDDPVRAHYDRQDGIVAVEPDPVWAPATAGPWLADRVGRLAGHERVEPDFVELIALMRQAARLAPVVRGRPVPLPVVPCPACHEVRLEQHAAPARVECAGCGAVLAPRDYRAWARQVAACS